MKGGKSGGIIGVFDMGCNTRVVNTKKCGAVGVWEWELGSFLG